VRRKIVRARSTAQWKITMPRCVNMLQGSNPSRNSTYLVPCVFKAVQMIEVLRETRTGLRVEDFRSMTGFPKTTIYRILRTLVACQYVIRDSGGSYRLNHSMVPAVGQKSNHHGSVGLESHAKRDDNHLVGFERWGVRFRNNAGRIGHPGRAQSAISKSVLNVSRKCTSSGFDRQQTGNKERGEECCDPFVG
jgi:hypothetical protein